MCFLEKLRSRRNARIASLTLREIVLSDVKKKFFATNGENGEKRLFRLRIFF